MAGNLGELVQMIATLSGVKAQKRKLDLDEQQLAQQAEQFAQVGEENKFAAALKLIAGSSAKTREGLQGLLGTLAPHHREAAMAMLQGQPIDPAVQQAESIQAGRAAMSPEQLGVLGQEAATINATGQNMGALAQSQFAGALAQGAAQQLTPQMAQAYAERSASGRDPITAAVQQAQMQGGMVNPMAQIGAGLRQTAAQQAQIGLGYANVAVDQERNRQGWAGLDQAERKMAAEYGLDKLKLGMMGQKGAAGGGLTGDDWLKAVTTMPTLLNDINKNTSDKAGNMARIRLFNMLNFQTGSTVPMLPLEGPGAPGKTGLLQQFFTGAGVLGTQPTAWPGTAAPGR